MKKFTEIIVVVSMLIVFSGSAFAQDTTSEFLEIYEAATELTHDLFENISEALSGEVLQTHVFVKQIDALQAHAETLEQLAEEAKRKESAHEARRMGFYLTRAKNALQSGKEQHALTMHLARYYLHFSNCVQVYPTALKELLHEHVGELKEALESGDEHEIEHLAEHEHLHAEQMHYAALMFGKKVWQKFTVEVMEHSNIIFEAAESGDSDVIQTSLEKVEKSVEMLMKVVK